MLALQVNQRDLERLDGVSEGKYTIGLGQVHLELDCNFWQPEFLASVLVQEGLAFCSDREDCISMALTVTQNLLEKHGVDPRRVCR